MLVPAIFAVPKSTCAPCTVKVVVKGALVDATFCFPKLKVPGEAWTEGVAVPDSRAVCGLPPPSSAMFNVADRVPVAVGLNTTPMVHVVCAARLVPQLLVSAKSPGLLPVNEVPAISTVVSDTLLTDTVFEVPLEPTAIPLQLRAVGVTFTALPTPERVKTCGLVQSLSFTFSDALRFPIAAGVKVTEIVQFAFDARLLEQFVVSANSPDNVGMLIANGTALTFVTVSTFAGLVVPIAWLLNCNACCPGLNATAVPRPCKVTTCGLAGSPSRMETVPHRLPDCCG
jgi:hypothetical protein